MLKTACPHCGEPHNYRNASTGTVTRCVVCRRPYRLPAQRSSPLLLGCLSCLGLGVLGGVGGLCLIGLAAGPRAAVGSARERPSPAAVAAAAPAALPPVVAAAPEVNREGPPAPAPEPAPRTAEAATPAGAGEAKDPPGPVFASPAENGVGEAVYAPFPEPWRRRFVEEWRARVAEAERDLATKQENLRRTIAADQRPRRQKLVKEAEQTLQALEANHPPYFTEPSMRAYRIDAKRKAGLPVTWLDRYSQAELERPLGVADLRVGAFGLPTGLDGRVFQVVSPKAMLMEVGATAKRRDTLVMVKAPTAGLVDGFQVGPLVRLLKARQLVYVSDTVRYRTPLGTSQTVFLVEVVSVDDPSPDVLPEVPASEGPAGTPGDAIRGGTAGHVPGDGRGQVKNPNDGRLKENRDAGIKIHHDKKK